MTPTILVRPDLWRGGARAEPRDRTLPEEMAVAITYGRETYAVMMATPDSLQDFAVGFSLTEGIVTHPEQITELEVVEVPAGVELRMSLTEARQDAARARRRRLAGPTGCGLCGIDSLEEAVRPAAPVTGSTRVTPSMVDAAIRAMQPMQVLGTATRATHAAALWHPERRLLALREDVGRHNALDKLAGAAARAQMPARDCAVLLSSRVSIEMVQKVCVMGVPLLIAVSAPTAHAVRLAEAAGLTLIAVARADGFEVFSHASRVVPEQSADAA